MGSRRSSRLSSRAPALREGLLRLGIRAGAAARAQPQAGTRALRSRAPAIQSGVTFNTPGNDYTALGGTNTPAPTATAGSTQYLVSAHTVQRVQVDLGWKF